MKTKIIVFVAAGLLLLTAGWFFIQRSVDPPVVASEQPSSENLSVLDAPRIPGTARVVPSVSRILTSVVDPVIVESENPSIRAFEPAQIVEEKIVTASEGRLLRRRAATRTG